MDRTPRPPDAAPGIPLLRIALATHRRDVLGASVLLSQHQLGEALVPVIVGAAVADAVAGHDGVRLALWLVALVADFVFLSLSYRFGARVRARARANVAHTVRLRVVGRVLDPAGGADAAPGDLLVRSDADAERVGDLAGAIASTASAACVVVVAGVALAWTSPVLALVVVGGTIALVLAVRSASHRLDRASHTEQEAAADAATSAEDTVRGLRVVHGLHAGRTVGARFALLSDRAAAAAIRATTTEGTIDGVAALLTGAYLAATATVGGFLALRGSLGLGALVAAVGLAQVLVDPLETLAGASSAWARARASAARVEAVLSRDRAVADQPPAAGEPAPPVGAPALAFVLDDAGPGSGRGAPERLVGWRAEAGELTALATRDAALARDLVRFLAREADPPSGRLTLDGTPFDAFALDDLRRAVLVSPHDAPCWRPPSRATSACSPRESPTCRASSARPRSTTSSRPSRTTPTRRSARTVARSRAGSANGSRSPARSPPRRRCSSCTTRPRPSTPSRQPRSPRGCVRRGPG
ncbi:multidrug ABC transporter ATP-binding protein [Luteimicrobium album]|uniref:Multidrug ABC transporter ATP-binding protein n=1 Tax=Luteimicrobium album TaxID=1054550 RepID=A0ABQ6HXU9_9MICO|nr:multidrug ABC transporter ATP-binding protein [Luteimicrobium album]